jgi:moderate conductance mechanosensitive channel
MMSFVEATVAFMGRVVPLEGLVATLLARGLVVLVTLLLAVFAFRIVSRLVDRLLHPLEGTTDYSVRMQRARTLAPLMKNATLYGLGFVVLVIFLSQIGVDMQALLLSAGVLSLAVGLGAQTLIKDVITGFFILFEGLISVGDEVEVGPHAGQVEAIGLRVTQIRLMSGALRIIPNGELTQFANYSKGWGCAVVEVRVPYETDVRHALDLLEGTARAWGHDTGLALAAPQAQGILRFADADLVLRLLVRVPAPRRFDAETELRSRIKEAFQREGVRLPVPERVVYLRSQNP